MDLDINILNESDKEKCGINYMWNLKKKIINLFTKQKQTHRHTKQTYGPRGERRGEGENRSSGVTHACGHAPGNVRKDQRERKHRGVSTAAQWHRICLPVQGVRSIPGPGRSHVALST